MSDEPLSEEEIAAIDAGASAEPWCDDCDRGSGDLRRHAPEVCPHGPGEPSRADARRLCRDLRQARADVLGFRLACGCIDGATLSGALGNIRHILRDGLQNPAEGIPDAAERVVARAVRAEGERDEMRAARDVLLAENDRLRARLDAATGMLVEVTRR